MSIAFLPGYVALWAFVLFQGLVIAGLVRSLAEVTSVVATGRFPQRRPIGSRAPVLSGVDLRTGSTFDSSTVGDRELVILFLSAACRVCRRLADGTRALPTEPHQARVAVCRGSTSEVAPFVDALPADIPVLVDPSGSLSASFGVQLTPVAFVVDAEGRIRGSGSPQNAAELAELITNAQNARPDDDQAVSLIPEEVRS
jgi:hypothetical protein